jgi:hypothetical protein
VIVALDGLPVTEQTLENVSKRLLNEEARHTEVRHADSEPEPRADTALMAVAQRAQRGQQVQTGIRPERTCYACGTPGHIARFCQSRQQPKESAKEGMNGKKGDATANWAVDKDFVGDEEEMIAY